ncbi:hypothetical protein [Stutzerimonas stutzeri]|uniref:hypothetical protein n=1 Tax=Stutzerimonas stutzeri TaxID=316 RepID=UPI00210E0E82|nr:hypothetical protein [Stutzerimonas stutzeri]MCQ4320853.1 hypothetical protein [Stutzerimonas stutzeri]
MTNARANATLSRGGRPTRPCVDGTNRSISTHFPMRSRRDIVGVSDAETSASTRGNNLVLNMMMELRQTLAQGSIRSAGVVALFRDHNHASDGDTRSILFAPLLTGRNSLAQGVFARASKSS